jgi:hypothetical protein
VVNKKGWYDWLQDQLGEYPFTIIFSSISFIAFTALLWQLTFVLGGTDASPPTPSLNQLVGLLGGLAGWSLGIAWSPFTPAEETRFRRITRVVSAFLGGYLLSKAEGFFDGVLFTSTDDVVPAAWERVGIFLAAFMLGLLVTFVHRLYAFQRADTKLVRVPAQLAGQVEAFIQQSTPQK